MAIVNLTRVKLICKKGARLDTTHSDESISAKYATLFAPTKNKLLSVFRLRRFSTIKTSDHIKMEPTTFQSTIDEWCFARFF